MYITNTLSSQLLRPPFTATPHLPFSPLSHSNLPRLSPFVSPLRSSSDGQNGTDSNPPPPITPPEIVDIRFRRGSRRRKRQLEKQQQGQQSSSNALPKTMSAPKTWEEMSLSEKAVELYMGEKGALYWLNKFAYASIFIVIGGWILFRFIGPSLNLYQLDTPPLAPDAMFKGSPK